MTVRELKKFMSLEQNIEMTDVECKQIIEEYEPSIIRRKSHLLSASGFSHFMVFSEIHDLIDHYQVRVQVILFEIDCAIFYTNLHELFSQFIS